MQGSRGGLRVHPPDGGDHPLPDTDVDPLILDDLQKDAIGGLLLAKEHGAPFRDTTIASALRAQKRKSTDNAALHFRAGPPKPRKKINQTDDPHLKARPILLKFSISAFCDPYLMVPSPGSALPHRKLMRGSDYAKGTPMLAGGSRERFLVKHVPCFEVKHLVVEETFIHFQ